MRIHLAALAAAALVSLAGCSSSTGPDLGDGSGPPTHVVDAAPAAATGPTPEAWCAVQLGDPKADVLAALGAPSGSKAAVPAGFDAAEWDVDQTIYLATFEDGKAANLQAYAGVVGPTGAAGLPCEPFRN